MKDTGGPAFPHSRLGSDADGMTLRDWFATHATEADIQAARHLVPMVTEVLNNFGPGPAFTEGRVEPKNWRQVARYLHADAMLKARNQ